ncbi:MAG: hypothetical protein A2600_13925 [Candidatus Lambdaproteobacteria bacterium RIFOXYD1_FULL_56_27]|uniref:NAD-dependent epimerase/dehydratase domain-containing protein n=1 Tax=Candidatus Lambdaproteobacteria bacterium RIFOXYD2_FULL_56_26 TaxID=1817773 RepID=A0A1F6GNM9_9PROT|nr:MAG: hypothetical protein A2557_06150 [Candidatus Lambdaproteobacteria bacterium RIFOXYD2_FULL_56_26]OGG99887.1 MAG: hypothetical protein A2426_09885 [Candidatus Lambdaproteobacteria bacterium RIFOXYC1_FULL_56_13]OGH06286.1 MAG: hypothetical protein A2600_13925 [Candidatus Lambdaproteobacteria bacterium RIFOXYD1_FULL_56_27]
MQAVGVLGYGYLGARVLAAGPCGPGSFAASRGEKPQGLPVPWVPFDWAEPNTWDHLPQEAQGLVLTIPPVHPDLKAEQARLETWGAWMSKHRPRLGRLVYLSSTAVYPNQPGLFDETWAIAPQSEKGQLRLLSEQVLARFFDLKVIRPAAIYGPDRSILERMRQGLPVPADSGPVYRIHVEDLARICWAALEQSDFPSPINALDLKPASSLEVAQWVHQRHPELVPKLEEGYLARRGFAVHPERKLSNQRLLETQFTFVYPSYQEGMNQ